MAVWAKVKIFWETMLGADDSTLTATTTSSTSDYDVDYIYNMSEVNKWVANTAATQYIIFDGGAGNVYDANYIAISGHNLYTAGATITLQTASATSVKSGGIEALEGCASASYDGLIYTYGGHNGSTYVDKLWSYNPATDVYTPLDDGITARRDHTLTAWNGKLYAFGGYDGSYLWKLDIYDIATDTWVNGTAGSFTRSEHTATAWDGKIYIFGGFFAPAPRLDLWEYDIVGDSWTQLTSDASGRTGHTAAIHNGKLYVFGGIGPEVTVTRKNDIRVIDLFAAVPAWSGGLADASIVRAAHGMVLYQDTLVVHGGNTVSAAITATTESYNIITDVWSDLTDLPDSAREDFGCATDGSNMYVTCGDSGSLEKDTWVYSIALDKWGEAYAEVTTWADVFTEELLHDDKSWIKEFAAPGDNRFWRVRLRNLSHTAPFLTTCIWGEKTELDYATASYDPYGESVQANVNISQGGVMAGTHTKYSNRTLKLNFADSDATLYNKVKAWWDGSGLNNFFVAWETANNPRDIWFVRPSTTYSNPLTSGGNYRNITLDLTGRKE